MSIHSGTHLDTPYHLYADGATVDQLDPARFCCPAILVDLKGAIGAGKAIEREKLRAALSELGQADLRGRALLVRTGWAEELCGTDRHYRDNPHLSVDAAEWVAAAGPALVGIDFPPHAIGREMVVPAPPAPVHETLLGAGVCILENLANLDRLPERRFELLCLPLKLEGQGGGPARVLARAL